MTDYIVKPLDIHNFFRVIWLYFYQVSQQEYEQRFRARFPEIPLPDEHQEDPPSQPEALTHNLQQVPSTSLRMLPSASNMEQSKEREEERKSD
mmetsp:Transcript_7323/g.12381  ORF Transcript_7323/g.12381 Transcript_7323/m.12381 type:complete len:93 (-) Transcript_7323:97-375(-)